MSAVYLGNQYIANTFIGNTGAKINAPLDPDIVRFLSSSAISSSNEIEATLYLVTQLKDNNLWDKFYALYPFIGSTQKSNAQNLISSNYTIAFSGGWTFNPNGIQGDGVDDFAATGINNSVSDFAQSQSLAIYSRTTGNNGYDIGASQYAPFSSDGIQNALIVKYTNGASYILNQNATSSIQSSVDGAGFYLQNWETNTGSFYQNDTKLMEYKATNTPWSTLEYYIGSINTNGVLPEAESTRNYALASFGKALSQAEVTTYYNIVNQYQTILGRNIPTTTTTTTTTTTSTTTTSTTTTTAAPTTTTTTTLPGSILVDYLVVAGGGGGSSNTGGAGGGAGGLVSGSIYVPPQSTLQTIVGAGGAINASGVNSSLVSSSLLSVTSIGGGRAAGYTFAAGNGGSGGGGTKYANVNGGTGTAGQGFAGGSTNLSGQNAGGGGASQAGRPGNSAAGAGGSGSQWLDGIFYAGGGGGGAIFGGTGGLGGPGGGGNGTNEYNSPNSGSAGVDGLGGGGGGSFTGNKGGSGTIIIRYAGSQVANGGDSIYSSGGYTYHKFTSTTTSSFTY